MKGGLSSPPFTNSIVVDNRSSEFKAFRIQTTLDQRATVNTRKTKLPYVHRPGPSAKQLGRPRNEDVESVRPPSASHKEGVGILPRQIGVGTSYVQRILSRARIMRRGCIASYLIEVVLVQEGRT